MYPHGYYYHRDSFVAAHVLALGNMMHEKWSKLQTIYNTFYIYISKFEFEYLVISQSQCLTVIARLREMVVWVLCFIMLFYFLASRGRFLFVSWSIFFAWWIYIYIYIHIYVCVCVCVFVCVCVCVFKKENITQFYVTFCFTAFFLFLTIILRDILKCNMNFEKLL